MHPRPLISLLFAAALVISLSIASANPSAPVTLTDDPATATLANGIVSAKINKANGNLLSLRYHDLDLLGHGGGYWNIFGAIPGQPSTETKGSPSVLTITRNPSDNGGEIGEISLRFPYAADSKSEPLDVEIRYTLHRGDSGVYGWTIADHAPDYPPFSIEQSTVCLKLNPSVFDFLSIDAVKQRRMASPEDWVNGTQLNLREARLLNSGIRKGQVEHKYDYSMLFSRTPAWGWSSAEKKIGLFVVNPSLEYLNGPPVKVDYGGHLDVKSSLPADPTLLFIWHGLHYGGLRIPINSGEHWRKIVGPFLLYCNAAETPQAMWQDSLARAAREQKAWPYAWAEAPGYEHAEQRGSATGELIVQDASAPAATAAGAWVGLSAPSYTAEVQKGEETIIDWQTDGKHYQYWIQAGPDGRFTIPNIRPGIYNLYAFTNGILGDFSRTGIQVEAGKTADLGAMTWRPVRYGRQLWEIGIPNRSAEEFRHGDEYWQWGLYNRYPDEFPDDVDFTIGVSDWRRDWNYAQPPRPDGKGGWKNTTWRIRFNIGSPLHGVATLRLAICGARGGPVDAALNEESIGSTGDLPESGVMHRDGIRSASLTERNLTFDAARLKPGENVITLTKHARAWTDGVLYDYLRLELDESKIFPK